MLKLLFIVFSFSTFVDCQICPDAYYSVGDGCFKPINSVASPWDHAGEICLRYNGGYLAIIDSCSLFGKLTTFFHLYGFESDFGYWVAATDSAEEGTWLWTDGSPVPLGVPLWGKVNDSGVYVMEPSGEENENCAQLSPSDQYYFHDVNCEMSGNILCQTDPLSATYDYEGRHQEDIQDDITVTGTFCPLHFQNVSGSCFHVTPETFTWIEAKNYCEFDMSSDLAVPKLAVLDDCNLFGELVDFINTDHPLEDGGYYFIGASDLGEEGSWYWVDYSPVTLGPPFWGSVNGVPRPSEDSLLNCAALAKDDFYYFNDIDCDGKWQAICQTDMVAIPTP